MAEPATRQDVQSALDRTKNTILGSTISRNDLPSVIGQLRMGILQDLRSLHAENQNSIRQAATHRDQLMQRLAALEHAVGNLQFMLSKLSNQHSQTATTITKMQPERSAMYQRF